MLFGLSWQAGLIAGLGCAMSSTALVISSLAERQQLMTRHGREAFAILLFQDLAVIPLLALLPLLGSEHAHGGANWMAAVKGIAAIGTVIAGSRLIAAMSRAVCIVRPGKTDRKRRPRRCVCLGRHGMDGLCRRKKADQG